MQLLSFDDFKSHHLERFDDMMGKTRGIDQFCSSSSWVLSAFEAFAQGDANPWIFQDDVGYAALYRSYHERIGMFAQPLEASWCLASPFATIEPELFAASLHRELVRRREEWDLLFLAGMSRHSLMYQSLIQHFSPQYFVGAGPATSRHRASLKGGLDGYLSRRTSKFRANLRRLGRRSREQGVDVEYFSASEPHASGEVDWLALYERMLAIEARSWKGELESGIQDEHMKVFYRAMIPRLAEREMLRALFLTRDGEDIAFIFGAVHQDLYRGLQVSFDNAHRHLSPGNLAQYLMIEWLCEHQVAWYDLGSELDYKSMWAEEMMSTTPLVIRPW